MQIYFLSFGPKQLRDRVTTLISLCENEVLVEKEQKLETNEVAKEQKSKVTKKDRETVAG